MKTIKDLKLVIVSLGGVMKIGGLEFEYKIGQDIDVKLDGDLIMWVSKDIEDDILLAEVLYTVNFDVENGKNARQEVKVLQKTIEELEKATGSNSLALGKVEAYEKILIGRELTIGK